MHTVQQALLHSCRQHLQVQASRFSTAMEQRPAATARASRASSEEGTSQQSAVSLAGSGPQQLAGWLAR